MALAPTTVTRPVTQPETNAAATLTGNFNNFLKMLMTQLRNQDPTSPMDTNEFTRELVQFSSVEQQIATNTSLTRLIELTQAGGVMQSAAMIGRKVTVDSALMPLQGGLGALRFELPADQTVRIAVLTEKGAPITEAAVSGKRGENGWNWDGKDANGKTLPDGVYRVSVMTQDTSGTSRAVAHQVIGVATGVESDGTAVALRMGALRVPMASVRSVDG
jgi:flagellar basal-body rod modification protein FlgD